MRPSSTRTAAPVTPADNVKALLKLINAYRWRVFFRRAIGGTPASGWINALESYLKKNVSRPAEITYNEFSKHYTEVSLSEDRLKRYTSSTNRGATILKSFLGFFPPADGSDMANFMQSLITRPRADSMDSTLSTLDGGRTSAISSVASFDAASAVDAAEAASGTQPPRPPVASAYARGAAASIHVGTGAQPQVQAPSPSPSPSPSSAPAPAPADTELAAAAAAAQAAAEAQVREVATVAVEPLPAPSPADASAAGGASGSADVSSAAIPTSGAVLRAVSSNNSSVFGGEIGAVPVDVDDTDRDSKAGPSTPTSELPDSEDEAATEADNETIDATWDYAQLLRLFDRLKTPAGTPVLSVSSINKYWKGKSADEALLESDTPNDSEKISHSRYSIAEWQGLYNTMKKASTLGGDLEAALRDRAQRVGVGTVMEVGSAADMDSAVSEDLAAALQRRAEREAAALQRVADKIATGTAVDPLATRPEVAPIGSPAITAARANLRPTAKAAGGSAPAVSAANPVADALAKLRTTSAAVGATPPGSNRTPDKKDKSAAVPDASPNRAAPTVRHLFSLTRLNNAPAGGVAAPALTNGTALPVAAATLGASATPPEERAASVLRERHGLRHIVPEARGDFSSAVSPRDQLSGSIEAMGTGAAGLAAGMNRLSARDLAAVGTTDTASADAAATAVAANGAGASPAPVPGGIQAQASAAAASGVSNALSRAGAALAGMFGSRARAASAAVSSPAPAPAPAPAAGLEGGSPSRVEGETSGVGKRAGSL